MDEPIILTQPLIVMFAQEEKVICHLYPREKDTHEGYGLLIADLIRHAADHFQVDPDAILDWVKIELANPTTDIQRPS